jgi:ferredoxin
MKAKVDQDACLGCGVCTDICAEVFEADDEGKAHVKRDPVPADLEESCRDAANQCPESAIKIEE